MQAPPASITCMASTSVPVTPWPPHTGEGRPIRACYNGGRWKAMEAEWPGEGWLAVLEAS